MSFARYHRQMLLPDWGEPGQKRLAASHALLVGCGALGCGIADFLVRAGIGTLTIVDRDVVELTNLQRQTLFDESDAAAGLPKSEAARRRLNAVNSLVTVRPIVADFTSRNARRLSEGVHVLLDGTDNFETRYLLNDLAVDRGIPYIYGGAVAMQGMAMTVIPGVTPCLRCVFEEPPPPGVSPTCDTAGVLGPIISIIAAAQAADALALLTGATVRPGGTLLDVELAPRRFRQTDVSMARRADCPACGLRRLDYLDGGQERMTDFLCGQNSVQVAPARDAGRVDFEAIRTRLEPHGTFSLLSDLLLRGTFRSERGENGDPIGLTLFADGRAIVKGTQRPELARSVYARFIGA
ncbi:MAG: ThiF family adenylyltransferase [Phycisphaeraceae bacterium]|nr:ThiF family adenylyltransferase [Phycisphaeraceae bacterium]